MKVFNEEGKQCISISMPNITLSCWTSKGTLSSFEFACNKLNKTRRGHKIVFRSVTQ